MPCEANLYVYSDVAIDRSMDHGCGRECVHTGEWTACAECAMYERLDATNQQIGEQR